MSVETTPTDTFLNTEGWPKVDLVKIDLEGAEAEVLAGMCQPLKCSNDLTLIIEFSPYSPFGSNK